MMQYYHKVMDLLSEFKVAKVQHIRREQNTRVDLLSKLASTKNMNHYHSFILSKEQLLFPLKKSFFTYKIVVSCKQHRVDPTKPKT